MPKAEAKDERAEQWRAVLAAGPEVKAALMWLLSDDVLQAVQNQRPPCPPDEGRFWAGVATHAHEFLAELNQVARDRRNALAEERSEG